MKRGSKGEVALYDAPPECSDAARTIDLIGESAKQSDVHVNLGQQVLIVSEDRILLCLNDYVSSAKKRLRWHTPAGMLVTEIVAFVTSSFHKTFGISAEQWQALFCVLVAATTCWLLTALFSGGPSQTSTAFIAALKTSKSRSQTMPERTLKSEEPVRDQELR